MRAPLARQPFILKAPMGVRAWLLLALVAHAYAAFYHSLGDDLVTPLVAWGGASARPAVRLYQGPLEAALPTRLAFSTPLPLLGVVNVTNPPPDLGHAPLVIRAVDTALLGLVSDAPLGLLRRTSVSARQGAHYIAVDVIAQPQTLLQDWTNSSKWKAALFLDPTSSIWLHYSCYALGTRSDAQLRLVQSEQTCATLTSPKTPMGATWSVSSYDYSTPRDATAGDGYARQHHRRAGALFLGAARILEPVLTSAQRATVMNCLEERCAAGQTEPMFPVVLDLESGRNYMPAELFYMQPPPPRIVLALGAGTPNLVLDWSAKKRAAFVPNSDSQEIVLGLAYARANYSSFVYNARTGTLSVAWSVPPAPEALRWVVSLLIVAQGILIVRWINSRNFASMQALFDARAAGSDGEMLPFDTTQAVYEAVALLLSALTLGLVARYMDASVSALFGITIAQWALHAAMSAAVLVLTYAATRRALWRAVRPLQSERRPPIGAPMGAAAGSIELVPTRYVIARNALHVLVLANGILMGLLLSSDSVVVMLAAIGVALMLLYQLAYYVSVVIVASLVLRRSITRARALWTIYVIFELAAYAAVIYSTNQFLIISVLDSINSFYLQYVLDFFAVALVLCATIAGVYAVFTDATHVSVLGETAAPAKPAPA
jgi:hypothetical protein